MSTSIPAATLTPLEEHPYPLITPIYTCNHNTGPLPISSSSTSKSKSKSIRPPLTLPHPCRTCHLHFTETLVKRIEERFADAMAQYADKIARANERIWIESDVYVVEARQMCRDAREEAVALRAEEERGAWRGFLEIWGK